MEGEAGHAGGGGEEPIRASTTDRPHPEHWPVEPAGATGTTSQAADVAGFLVALEGRSPYATTCPFFRALDAERLGPPVEAPDPTNRCAAFGPPKPQSTRQQELVCLTMGHVNCPRYLRGALVLQEASMPRRRTLTGATLAAIVILIAAVGASFAFVVARGGLDLPVSAVAPSGTLAAAASPSSAAVGTLEPSASLAPTPTPTPAPSLPPSPNAPLATPSTAPTTTPQSPTPRPTSDRYALLKPCPDKPDCYIYVVRSGDNLVSIANYFGVPLETVYDLNPWARTGGLRAGQQLILPPPTR